MTHAAAGEIWRIGENVPWVAAWTGEQPFRLARSQSFPGRVEIIQRSAPGEGAPIFDGMHVLRQRAGVVDLLCHVCGAPTPKGDRWLFPVPTGVFVTLKTGERRYASHLPPTHRACAERAQRLCPHLRLSFAQPVRFPTDAGRLRCETNAPPGMAELVARLPPGEKVVFSYLRVYPAGFSRLVERLRRAAGADGAAGAGQGGGPVRC